MTPIEQLVVSADFLIERRIRFRTRPVRDGVGLLALPGTVITARTNGTVVIGGRANPWVPDLIAKLRSERINVMVGWHRPIPRRHRRGVHARDSGMPPAVPGVVGMTSRGRPDCSM